MGMLMTVPTSPLITRSKNISRNILKRNLEPDSSEICLVEQVRERWGESVLEGRNFY